MALKNKHIAAFLLTGIFVFPFLFQSVHTFRHKHHIHIGHECITTHSADKYGGDVHKEELRHCHKTKHCLICEYKTSVNDLLSLVVHKTMMLFIKELADEKIIVPIIQRLKSFTAPRAPPCTFS